MPIGWQTDCSSLGSRQRITARQKEGMTTSDKANRANNIFNLERFVVAQHGVYDQVLSELRNGRKRSHWMWYIFPQIDGLASSSTAKRYAIKSREEACKYLEHPVLGARLIECAETVSAAVGRSAAEIFGYPDDLKLRSSMTLFAAVSDGKSIFSRVLDQFFHGQPDQKTLDILQLLNVEKAGNSGR